MASGRADPDGEVSPVALELRVHGVHNTPPTSMLGIEKGDLAQVAGDGLTGFYRSRSGNLPYRVPKSGLAVEAYSWGALTSGARGLFGWVQRALWLLLLPFALANMAYWARLRLGERRYSQDGRDLGASPDSRLGASAVRVASLLLTVFFVVVVATVFVDLVGWQCYRGGTPACPGMPSRFDWLGSLRPGQRLAVGALAPLLVILVSTLLTNKSLARYEGTDDPTRSQMAPSRGTASDDSEQERRRARDDWVLRHPDLWNGAVRTRILRDAHLAAAMAVLVGFLGVHLLHVLVHEHRTAPWRAGLWVLVLLAAVVLVLAVTLTCCTLPRDLERQLLGKENLAEKRWVWSGRLLVWCALAITVATLVVLYFLPDGGVGELDDFYGRNAWFAAIFIALTSLHLFVFAGGRVRGWMRYVAPLVIPVLLVGGYLLVRATAWSGKAGAAGRGADRALLAWLVVVAAFVVLAIWHYALLHDTRLRAEEAAEHGVEPDERDRELSGSAFAGAGASVLLAGAAWTALLFATVAVVGAANMLNGSATVTRLQTFLPPSEVPAAVPAGTLRPDLTVSGPVLLTGAVYEVVAGRLVVYSGNVTVTEAWRGRPDSGTAPLSALPHGEQLDVSTLALSHAYVTVQNSCDYGDARAHRPGAGPWAFVCQESRAAGFVDSKVQPVASKVLRVSAPSTTVGLHLRRPGYTPLVVPTVMVWAPLAQTIWLLLVGLAVLGCLVRFGPARRAIVGDWRAYRRVPRSDLAGAQGGRASAAFAHRAERILDVIGFLTSPIALAVIVFSSLRLPPWTVLGHVHLLADLSIYVVLGAASALVLLGSRIRTSDSTRRAVGVIWDLATFWPRAAHPLAPPCYSERVVPEISRRVMWALDASGTRRVVLSGHSQGSLIVTTVVARMQDLHRIRMITYGSQVRALYGRFFPAVFGGRVVGYADTTGPTLLSRAQPDARTPRVGVPPAPRGSLRAHLASPGHWVNLFRRTDPLGFRVFSDKDSRADVPTLEVPLRVMGDPGPPIKGHSDYQHSPEYRRQLKRWTHETFVEPPTSTTDVSPLPAP